MHFPVLPVDMLAEAWAFSYQHQLTKKTELFFQTFFNVSDVLPFTKAPKPDSETDCYCIALELTPELYSSMVLHYSSRKLQELGTGLTTIIKPGVYRGHWPGV